MKNKKNTPEVNTTDVTPTVNTVLVETPTVETPTVETPTVETPTVETPTVETPTVRKPIVDPKKEFFKKYNNTKLELTFKKVQTMNHGEMKTIVSKQIFTVASKLILNQASDYGFDYRTELTYDIDENKKRTIASATLILS